MPKEYWNEFRVTRCDDGWTIALYTGELYKPLFDLSNPFWGALLAQGPKLSFGAKNAEEATTFPAYATAMEFFKDHESQLRALAPKDTSGP